MVNECIYVGFDENNHETTSLSSFEYLKLNPV